LFFCPGFVGQMPGGRGEDPIWRVFLAPTQQCKPSFRECRGCHKKVVNLVVRARDHVSECNAYDAIAPRPVGAQRSLEDSLTNEPKGIELAIGRFVFGSNEFLWRLSRASTKPLWLASPCPAFDTAFSAPDNAPCSCCVFFITLQPQFGPGTTGRQALMVERGEKHETNTFFCAQKNKQTVFFKNSFFSMTGQNQIPCPEGTLPTAIRRRDVALALVRTKMQEIPYTVRCVGATKATGQVNNNTFFKKNGTLDPGRSQKHNTVRTRPPQLVSAHCIFSCPWQHMPKE